jgi:hypoxanthine-DNA glycosylase
VARAPRSFEPTAPADAPSVGFPPLASPDARVLILGSLPGRTSLERRQYYAQPYNAFWKIMGALFDAGPEIAYDERVRRLLGRRIAVWDVLAAGERAGSLDSSIVRASMVVNDFAGFFAAHARIEAVFCNGGTAAELYRRRVLPTLAARFAELPVERLPSTSPAHASLRFEQKLARWRAALERPLASAAD